MIGSFFFVELDGGGQSSVLGRERRMDDANTVADGGISECLTILLHYIE